jgi:hypothetical protein
MLPQENPVNFKALAQQLINPALRLRAQPQIDRVAEITPDLPRTNAATWLGSDRE